MLGILNTSDSELWEWNCYTQCKLVKLLPQVLQKNPKILLRTNKRISSAGESTRTWVVTEGHHKSST